MSSPKKIFGTDGVRGTANIEPVTAETALKLGRAAAHVFKNLEVQSRGRGKHKIVIGKDTRLSGYLLENAISSGILSMGVDVLFIGTSDLTAELGISGQVGHPKVVEAYQAVGEACRRHGKVLGMGGVYDEQHASRYVAMGARFVLTGADHSYIMTGASQRSKFFNGLADAPT